MWFTCEIETNQIPASVNKSYGNFGFYKFGLGCWAYDVNGIQRDGEVEWINTTPWCSQPKYPNPICFRYWFAPGVIASVHLEPTVRTDIADTVVAGIAMNWARQIGIAALAAL